MFRDNDKLKNCGVELIVRVFGKEEQDSAEIAVIFPISEVNNLTLSKVGTALQRQVYESLRQAYTELDQARRGQNSA